MFSLWPQRKEKQKKNQISKLKNLGWWDGGLLGYRNLQERKWKLLKKFKGLEGHLFNDIQWLIGSFWPHLSVPLFCSLALIKPVNIKVAKFREVTYAHLFSKSSILYVITSPISIYFCNSVWHT